MGNETSNATNNAQNFDWNAILQTVRETTEQMKETDRRMKETDRQMRETDRKMKEAERLIKELSTRFTSQSGHILEGLMEPSAIRMFQKRGYNINRCWKNFKRYSKDVGRKMEIDLLLLDDDIAIVVEVKINCNSGDVDHFLSQMEHFKEVCPEYSDKRVLVAVASVNYDREADKYAHERGVFVIRVHNDNIFTLDDTKNDNLIEF